MIFTGILAGGIGSRMNIADMPKQFLPLMGKPIIIHTTEKFLVNNKIDYIYIGVHKNWITHMNDLITKYLEPFREKIKIVSGGEDRNDTIKNIISAIKEDFTTSDDDIILTHDAVRPFITARIIDDNINAARDFGACDTAIPASDTIAISEDKGFITSIPKRDNMYQGQTPQSFKLSVLSKVLFSLSVDEQKVLTDACKACVIKEVPVAIVAGEVQNMKITTITDLKIAEHLVGLEDLKFD